MSRLAEGVYTMTQAAIVAHLKAYIDNLDDRPKWAAKGILWLMSRQPGRVATNHVLHNIGKRRAARLMEFLSKH